MEYYRGIAKLVEECGEVLQLLGKAMAFPDGEHPDKKGPLNERLPIELACWSPVPAKQEVAFSAMTSANQEVSATFV